MSIESMKRISECEEEAVSIRRQAQADARQILDQGKKQAEELVEAARKHAADDYRATLAQAEAEAGAAYDKSLAEVQKECSRMKSEARSKLPKAVEIITGKVVKSSGNCLDGQAFHYRPRIRQRQAAP